MSFLGNDTNIPRVEKMRVLIRPPKQLILFLDCFGKNCWVDVFPCIINKKLDGNKWKNIKAVAIDNGYEVFFCDNMGEYYLIIGNKIEKITKNNYQTKISQAKEKGILLENVIGVYGLAYP